MKAKIDEIWAIYRINLGQNSRWNINLQLKINFGRWIKNWDQSGRWIAILPLESHLDRRINTGVIWVVRSRCMKEGKYHQKISDISPIYHRYITDISPIFCHQRRFFQKISDISPIFWWYLRKYLPFDFSSRNIVSTPPDILPLVFPSWWYCICDLSYVD